LYNEFIQNKPDHPFTPIFEKVLVSLKEIKEKSTSIDTVVEDTLNNAINNISAEGVQMESPAISE
jgi:hypothetical protein